jgi:hypothetical protein
MGLLALVAVVALGSATLRGGLRFAVLFAVVGPYLWVRIRRSSLQKAYVRMELSTVPRARFDHSVADLLREFEFRDVHVPEPQRRIWTDIRCRDRVDRSVIVRCQRPQGGSGITARDVKRFDRDSDHRPRPERRIFITTSGFTDRAERVARRLRVRLIDGGTLSRLIRDTRSRRESGHAIPVWDRFEL